MNIHPLREAIEDYGIEEALRVIVQIAVSRPSLPPMSPYSEKKFIEQIEVSIDLCRKFISDELKELRES